MASDLLASVLGPGGAAVLGLLLLRLTGLVWTAPVFSSRAVPMQAKAAILVVLTALMAPPALRAAEAAADFTVATVVSELLIGLALGTGAGIFIGAAEAAGDMLAVQMGLSGANVLDPMSETQLPVLGHLMGLFATTAVLAVGGHLVILEALAGSLRILPPGAPLDLVGGPWEVVRLGSTFLWLGLQMAAPVIAAMMIGNVALGVLARTVPQLNVLMVAFPVQIGVGLFVLAATLPLVATLFGGWNGAYRDVAARLLEGLATTGGGG